MKYVLHNITIASHKWVSLVCALLIACVSYAQAPTVSTKIDRKDIKIGEQIQFVVAVEVDTTAQVIFPEGQTFMPLEVVEALPTDTVKENSRYILQRTYALTQFDSGVYKLPQQKIEINSETFLTDSLRISVNNIPVDTIAQKMYDIKPLINVEKQSNINFLVWLFVLLGILVIAGVLYWFVFREKPLTEEEKVALLPPYDRALLELKNLENSKYLIQDDYKSYYTELTDIVRSYLEEDVKLSALESTTDELINKLEFLTDSGALVLEKDTLQQFKQILQTADLVKFAKNKPASAVAETHRLSIEEIVTKTHDAIPEPTEEELLEQEEYREEMERKQLRKKYRLVTLGAVLALFLGLAGFANYYGPQKLWDTITRNETKILLDGEWVSSSYGYPPILLETPVALERVPISIPAEYQAQIKEIQSFAYQNKDAFFNISATATTLASEEEPDHEKSIEHFLETLERKGAKNIITKNEEFATVSGVKGLKTYGSGKFKVPDSDELIRGEYMIFSFGGKGFQQQIFLSWKVDDTYAKEIIDRIVKTLEVKKEA